MADVYKFKVELDELENVIWREIELTSVSSVAKLGYAILASFESAAMHLFNIRHKGKLYEILFEEDEFGIEPIFDPITTKLEDLKLSVGDSLTMEYDYGAGWEFSIELVAINKMQRGQGRKYPCVTNGKGKGIIEDTSTYELLEIIDSTNKGEIPKVWDVFSNQKIDWDYKDFDLKNCNRLVKENLIKIKNCYEIYK